MKQTIEYIEEMVCFNEHIESDILHTPGKHDPFVTIRQIIMTLALEQNYTMYEIGNYFSRTHVTVINARKTVNNRCDTEKVFAEKYYAYQDMLRDKESFKVAYMANELARLKTETMALQEQLNQIAI